jgi:hypothetical protein
MKKQEKAKLLPKQSSPLGDQSGGVARVRVLVLKSTCFNWN